MPGEPPLTQHRQDQGAGGGFQETRAENTHPSPSTRHLWSGVNSFKFLCVHITEDLTWSAHTDAVLKKAHHRPLLPETAEEVWNEPPASSDPSSPLHCGEHPDRLHHRLVGNRTAGNRKALAKGCANCPPHCWRWASLPPGHLHPGGV